MYYTILSFKAGVFEKSLFGCGAPKLTCVLADSVEVSVEFAELCALVFFRGFTEVFYSGQRKLYSAQALRPPTCVIIPAGLIAFVSMSLIASLMSSVLPPDVPTI